MKKEWYVVNTVSGYEYKVKEKLEMMIKNSSEIQEKIFRVIVPEQTIVEYKDGQYVDGQTDDSITKIIHI